MSTNEHPVEQLSAAFRALGDPTRLRIVQTLSRTELRVSEVVEVLRMGQSRISRHLRILVEADMLTARRDGVWTFYRIDHSSPHRCLLDHAMRAAETVAEDEQRLQEVLAKRREETRAFFDSHAGSWETMRARVFGEFDVDQTAEELIEAELDSIADLGCGEGTLIERLAPRAQHAIGVDNSPAMLDVARKRLADRSGIEFRLGDIEHLPLKDSEVDAVIMSLVLHHLPRPKDAIDEAIRVVKSGGHVAIVEFEPHEHEAFRSTHGDRWLGIEPGLIRSTLEDADCLIEHDRQHNLEEGIKLRCVAARKNHHLS